MTPSRPPKHSNRVVRFGLGLAVAAAVLGSSAGSAALAQTTPAPLTASSTAGQTTGQQALTLAETEGPYYKTNSPETTNLVQNGVGGTPITITGQVLDQNGQPVANALLDFWQANASGAYDTSGFTLRGHQYTDANGFYTLTTIQPGLYPGRTEHIHVKVQAPNGPVLTTQLYFPGVAQNTPDSIYDPSLLLNVVSTADSAQSATFDFVIATA
ncbi:MAG: dioxygenase [Chloroflexota bacterium]